MRYNQRPINPEITAIEEITAKPTAPQCYSLLRMKLAIVTAVQQSKGQIAVAGALARTCRTQ